MIFSGTDGVKAAIDLDDRTETSPHVFLVAADSVLVSYNEENSFIYKIDNDKDGVYETEVMAGDTDCNNSIDAVDASNILDAYAASQTSHSSDTIYAKYADYNGDGKVDSVDASCVLQKYAELSTTK